MNARCDTCNASAARDDDGTVCRMCGRGIIHTTETTKGEKMKTSHIIISDSFTREPRAVAVNFSDAARRANLAALLRGYRAAGYRVRTIETGAMYSATTPAGYRVSIWYAVPNVHRFSIIAAVQPAPETVTP